MIMDDGEIIREYKEARTKMKQVGILAELNCVSKQEMAQWLLDHGQEVAKNFWPKKKFEPVTKEDIIVEEEPEEVAEEEPIQEEKKDLYMKITEDAVIFGNNARKEPTCTLTKEQAYAVAGLIDACLVSAVRAEVLDDVKTLRDIVYAYDMMCVCSGYEGVTE